jgi:hypothetical protein
MHSVTSVLLFVASASALLLTSQAGAIQFEAVDPERLSAAATFANAWADFDGDGDLDLFVGMNGAPNRLYRNDKGTLNDVAAKAGVADARATRAAAWADADGDGDPDLLVGFTPGAGPVLKLYRNDRGTFVDATELAGLKVDAGAVRQLAWVDVDSDFDLDLFVAFRDRPNALFVSANSRLIDVAASVGLADPRRSVGASWFDYDEDGDLDLSVANMDGDANGLFRNDKGKFTDVAKEAGAAGLGREPGVAANGTVRPCAVDINNDGHLDLVGANYGSVGLLLNRGGGKFEDVSAAWKIAIDARYDTCAPADVDHDGKIDLYINGTVTGGQSYRDYLFRNVGMAFQDATPDVIRKLNADHGAAWADFDDDGDLDLALTGVGTEAMPLLFRNLLPAQLAPRSIFVRVIDGRGRATMAGAEVRIYEPGTRKLIGTRLVDSGSGYNTQDSAPVHFGLPTLDPIEIEVTWPANGRRLTPLSRIVTPQVSRLVTVVVMK